MRTSLTFGVLWALIGVMAPISLAQTDKTDKPAAGGKSAAEGTGEAGSKDGSEA